MNKFNMYDFIAVLVPGIFFLWCLNIFFSIESIPINIPLEGDLTKVTVLIVLGYITGLLLQGLSQGIVEPMLKFIWGGFPSERWLLDADNKLSQNYKLKFWEKLHTKFQKAKPVSSKLKQMEIVKDLKKQNQECFYLAYRSVKSETILMFNAQYGLFRVLFTTFIILLIWSCTLIDLHYEFPFNFYVTDDERVTTILPIFLLSVIGSIITYFRTKKRGEDFTKSVLDTFLTV